MKSLRLGVDIGSTTEKIVLLDRDGAVVYSDYVRHNTKIAETLVGLLNDIKGKLGDVPVMIAFAGSAGMGIAEKTGTEFVQEIIAATASANKLYPEIKSLIDIGGEDAKLVLFNDNKKPDIRMNGNCAGGTGAYIDQMATLMNVSVDELNEMAWKSTKIYPIASRCGVFAKTDVQNLISRKINGNDIAASIFSAVAGQIVNSVARGCVIEPKLLFCGGPLSFISYLREAFADLLKIKEEDIILPERAELFTALGTALSMRKGTKGVAISELIARIEAEQVEINESNTLTPLFRSDDEFEKWDKMRSIIPVPEREVVDGMGVFIGIDSGSTTTKITICDAQGNLVYKFYKNSNGHPLETVVDGLKTFSAQLLSENKRVNVLKCAVTGYGEELVKSALGLDFGIVETVAHFLAAKKMEPEVSFILDIGGQDIKAIYVQNNTITNIEINEACSSGCGSFIEGFAQTLGYERSAFSDIACSSQAPYDLGSRCTVFMNSKVKQALRDGATVADLSAGLAYSVVKNCLNKVLKIKSSEIGDHIVVQGGTFRNKAVFRSLEILSEKKIVVSEQPELMGAYGAALYAMSKHAKATEKVSSFVGFDNLDAVKDYTTKLANCKACTNNCQITVYQFPNGKNCYSGNKCEKVFSNNSIAVERGENIFEYKKQILFKEVAKVPSDVKLRIGIPRILNIYENIPFWNALFAKSGIEVVLSDESTMAIYKKGNGAIMSDNICFPAKLSHGHIVDLVEKRVDRIFFPFVVYEKKRFDKSSNSFNCPVVTGYSEVLKSTSQLLEQKNIPFDAPGINFNDNNLLKKACYKYLKSLGVSKSLFNTAFAAALEAQHECKVLINHKNQEILNHALQHNKPVVLVASHPYHIDQVIHQQSSQILSDLGVNVINEEIAINAEHEGFDKFFSISQWEYPNRILEAAWWATRQKFDVGLIQLNSFGCGPDSFIVDEISDLVKKTGTSYSLIRIDEISSPGSTKLRLRSMVESLKLKTDKAFEVIEHTIANERLKNFGVEDKEKLILVPWLSDFYSPFIPIVGKKAGYTLVNLPPSNQSSIDLGLDYANNEVCFPGTLVVGDVVRALKSNQYDRENIAIGITQTGGQCRATNYIALIRRAMVSAGYADIPVVAVASVDDVHNLQPGFQPNWRKVIMPAFMSMMFADSLSRLYYSTVCREINKGDSARLRDKYIEQCCKLIEMDAHSDALKMLKSAIEEFNAVEVHSREVQAVGVVGEIYIKYNAFGQFDVVDWMVDNGVEVVIPPLVHFFMQSFVNSKVLQNDHIDISKSFNLIAGFVEWRAGVIIKRFEKALKKFKYYRPVKDIKHEAELASEILSLSNQYGEGWLIPAEIASFAQQKVNDVICMQPFGCIANHIVGKGMEKKIKKQYPDMNLLFLDFDYGTSKVNILNRMHFLIQNQVSEEVVEE